MSIFKEIANQIKSIRIGKLYIDVNGNAFLYNYSKCEFQEITLFTPDKFRGQYYYAASAYDYKSRDGKQKSEEKKIQTKFDHIRVYSAQIEENTERGKKTVLRYGFINENGYAITHATYDKVEILGDYARVYLNGYGCRINEFGFPIWQGSPFDKAEFVFVDEKGDYGFTVCCIGNKYGLINKYRYLCIPCEYDNINLIYDLSGNCICAVMRKNGIDYTAVIEENAICNILHFIPKSIQLKERFLLVEETITQGEKSCIKQGLLNRGGIRILNSEYDCIDIVSKCIITAQRTASNSIMTPVSNVASIFAIVSKENYKQLLFITETSYNVIIKDREDIKFGEGYDKNREMMFYYASIDKNTIKIFMSLRQQGGFCIFKDEFVGSYEYDRVYFSYNGIPNNYFAAVEGNKTKLINRYNEEIMPSIIPSEYHVKTDSYNEGIVGIYMFKQEKNALDKTIERPYYSYINSEGKILADFEYYEIEKFENGQAWAYFSGGARLIDKNGNIIRTEYDKVQYEPREDNWRDYVDDAFEGDSGAYWNID